MMGYTGSQRGAFRLFCDAWCRVRLKNGSPGVDGETVGDFEQNLRRNLQFITEQFESGRYRLSPLKRVSISKKDDSVRYVEIPTVRDRIVLRAVNSHLVGLWDSYFSTHSFAYRPGKNCRDAARIIREAMEKGNVWYARGDIKGCFDSLDWNCLSAILRRAIADHDLRQFVNRSFRMPFIYQGTRYVRLKGIPMGSPVSPTLANAYLHQFDAEMSDLGYDVIRYGDDWICMSRDRQGAVERLKAARQILSGLKIEINPEKSGIGNLRGNTILFLGYEINAYEITSSSWNMEDF
jgi:RNA-directed DNA polymerase